MPDHRDSAGSRRVRVEHVMGTAVSLDLREPFIGDDAVDEMFAWLRDVDARFSTYRESSEVNAIRRGELDVDDASADLTVVLALCEGVRRQTDGAFDIWRHHPAGLDPSALVKGWSIDRAADILFAAGAERFCINAGGDVLCYGGVRPDTPWRIGLRHPRETGAITAVVCAGDLAVATSGAYERGSHIRDPRGNATPSELLSATVAGPNLALADAYATAVFTMGLTGVTWLADASLGFAAYVVTSAGRTVWTAGFDSLLERQEARL
jgi:thiamine biosynthesis lipoprotein